MKRSLIGVVALLCLALPLRAEPISKDVYKLMHLEVKDVLTGPILTSRVLPGMTSDPKQVVALVTYMTGKRDESSAVNVRLEVMRKDGDALASIYTRDFGAFEGRRVINHCPGGRHALRLFELGWQTCLEAVDPADEATTGQGEA